MFLQTTPLSRHHICILEEKDIMSKVFLAFVIGFSLLTIPACNSDNKDKDKELSAVEVPASVKSAFSAKYSTVTDAVWEDAHENNQDTYKVKFTVDGKKMKAEYSADGTLIKEKEDN